METEDIVRDRFYSNGKRVRKVVRVEGSWVFFRPCEFFKPISTCASPEDVTITNFAEWAKFEVVPNWAKVVR